MAGCVLGIDVSTTSVKALLAAPDGRVIASASTEQAFQTPRPLWAEQDPAAWWANAQASVRAALAQARLPGSAVEAVGLTGQMHGLVLLDADGQALRPAILWNDQRTAAECAAITARVGEERLLRLTGNRALPGFTAPKLLWVRRHEPALYARAAHLLLPKDFVRLRMTGEYAMDAADGSGTILFDLARRTWSPELLDALEIPRAWLPPVYEGPAVTGRLTRAAAEATGLAPGTPVVAGAGDQAAQAVGVGAVTPGVFAVTLGTSGVVFAATAAPVVEPEGRLHAFCHAAPGAWHLMGVMLSAAGSLQWHRDTFAPGRSFDALCAAAGAVSPGSEGLLFLPYLTGERTPHPDPLARGAFIGLTVRHTFDHLTRAVLEGVAFGLQDMLALFQAASPGEVRQLRVSGGGARSPVWRQILADVTGSPLALVNTTEGAAYGAALLAGVGAGWWRDVPEACAAVVRVVETVAPRPEAHRRYQSAYAEYRSLYPLLKDTFARLGESGQ